MNSEQTQFDASRFYDFVSSMDRKTMNRAERDALRKSVRLVSRQTKRNLRARWPKSSSTKGGGRPSAGVIANVQKATNGQLYGQVHIMGSGSTGSRGYLLRFFEMGTVDRFSRVRSRAYRGRSTQDLKSSGMGFRGRIKALWFFRDAVASTKSEVFEELEDRMEDAVVTQWAKSAVKGGQI